MSRRVSKPKPMSAVMGRVLEDLGLEKTRSILRLSERWNEVVGPEIAAHCQPVAVRAGVLEASVDSSVWCQQLQLQREELLASLRRVLGDDAPRDLRFVVGYHGSP